MRVIVKMCLHYENFKLSFPITGAMFIVLNYWIVNCELITLLT